MSTKKSFSLQDAAGQMIFYGLFLEPTEHKFIENPLANQAAFRMGGIMPLRPLWQRGLGGFGT
jgi:hypothetical protein